MIASSLDSYVGRTGSRRAFAVAVGIFAVAVAARLPSCNESFWLDELHSAWSVWGNLGEVANRAADGNQTPFYFWALWGWKQALGESEFILRLPSVLASSLAASVVAYSIVQTRQNLLAGMTAGLIMALESNSIFYGTELRPFAFVILLSAIGCWVLRPSHRKPSWMSKHTTALLALIAMLAFALQPTSIGVFAWLVLANLLLHRPIARQSERDYQPKTKLKFIYLFATFLISAQVIWFGVEILATAWKHRTQWTSVGQATSLLQFWNAWPWIGLVIAPSLLWMIAKTIAGLRRESNLEIGASADRFFSVHLVAIALLAVGTFWTAAVLEVAPVFHRRYFIACLPILASASGEIIANTIRLAERMSMPSNVTRTLTFAAAAIPLVIIAVTQGLPAKLTTGDFVLVRRGEGWKQAVSWLQDNHARDQVVRLSPGLIETERLLGQGVESPSKPLRYLAFPLSGPYSWKNVEIVNASAAKLAAGDLLVLRGSPAMGRLLLESQENSDEIPAKLHTFGGVQVLDLSNRKAVETK